MRVSNKYYTTPNYSISQAVISECDGEDDYDRGELETIKAGLERTTEMLGRLMERLNEDGALSDERVLELLGATWRKIE